LPHRATSYHLPVHLNTETESLCSITDFF